AGLPYVVQVAAVNARGQGPFSLSSTPNWPALPFAITPIIADAGYFEAVGECPRDTASLSYRWTNASNGDGWGSIRQRQGTFALQLRMLASGPGVTIQATFKCIGSNGRSNKVLGSYALLSGVNLLPLPANSGTGRRIVYSVSAQQLWMVDLVNPGVHQPVLTSAAPTLVDDPTVGVLPTGSAADPAAHEPAQ